MFGSSVVQKGDSKTVAMDVLLDVIDTHIHLSEHYKGGLPNGWHPNEADGFRRDA